MTLFYHDPGGDASATAGGRGRGDGQHARAAAHIQDLGKVPTGREQGVIGLQAAGGGPMVAGAEGGARLDAQTRAHAVAFAGTLLRADAHGFALQFDEPSGGVTPGQLCVLYDGDEVVGAGNIL